MGELQTEIFSYSGRRGTGKSTLVTSGLKRTGRVVLWDPLAEHGWCPNPIYDLDDFEEFLRWGRSQQNFACRFIPQGEPVEEFEDFCFQVFQHGALVVAIEEIPLVCSSASFMPTEFGRLVRMSRHRRIHICWTAQRFAEVPRTLTALTDVFLIFGASEPRDLDALADRTSPEIADAVANLELHEAIRYDVRTREALRVTSRGEILGPLPSTGRRLL